MQAGFVKDHITLDTSTDLHVYVGVDLFQFVCELTVDQMWLLFEKIDATVNICTQLPYFVKESVERIVHHYSLSCGNGCSLYKSWLHSFTLDILLNFMVSSHWIPACSTPI